MLIYYFGGSPPYGGEPRRAVAGGRPGRPVLRVASSCGSPVFGVLSDRVGHRRIMLVGPAFGAVAVVITALTVSLPVIALHAPARGRRPRRRRSRRSSGSSPSPPPPTSCCGAGRSPGSRPRRWRGCCSASSSRARCSTLFGPTAFLAQRARSTASRSRSTAAASRRDAEPAPAARGPRPRRGPAPLRADPARPPRLAARAHLDRHQRHARPVHEPDAVPAGPRARTRGSRSQQLMGGFDPLQVSVGPRRSAACCSSRACSTGAASSRTCGGRRSSSTGHRRRVRAARGRRWRSTTRAAAPLPRASLALVAVAGGGPVRPRRARRPPPSACSRT